MKQSPVIAQVVKLWKQEAASAESARAAKGGKADEAGTSLQSVLEKNQEKDVRKGLKSASGFLRRELGHALQLRYTPELQFIADDSIAYGAHILEVLRDPEKVKPANPDNDAVLPEEE